MKFFKKVIVLLVALFISFTFVSCKKEIIEPYEEVKEDVKNFELTLEVGSTHYANLDYPSKYNAQIDDETIVSFNDGFFTALKVGKTTVTITTNDDKAFKHIYSINVIEEKTIDVTYKDRLYVGDEEALVVKSSNKEIKDYEVFIDKVDLLKYEKGKLIALKEGNAKVTITATIDGKTISKSLDIEIVKKDESGFEGELVVDIKNTLYNNQTIGFTVKTKDGSIVDDYEVDVDDEDLIECYPEDNELMTLSEGTTKLTFTATIDSKLYGVVIEVTIAKSLSLDVRVDDVITTEKPLNYEVYVMPDNVKLEEFKVSSSDQKVFTITNKEITPVGIGKALIIISGTYNDALVSTSKQITVKEYIPDYIESNIDDFMLVNNSLDVSLKILPSLKEVKDLVITSSDESVVEVSNQKLIAKKVGSTKVTVSASGLSKEYNINVIEVNEIEIEMVDTIYLHEVVSFKVIAKPSNTIINLSNLNLEYKTDNDNLLINDHAIFGEKAGTSKVNVTLSYYKNGGDATLSELSCSKDVTIVLEENKVERVTVTAPSAMIVGTSTILPITKYPSDGEGVISISSSDSSVVEVEGNKITAKKEGVCEIIVSASPTISSSVTISVIAKKDDIVVSDGLFNGNPITARYRESEILKHFDLMCGVTETTYFGYTSTQLDGDVDGYTGITGQIEHDKFYEQHVHVLEVPSRTDVVVIPWANLNNHKWSLTTVKGLIINFEEHNPGYKVIAAVNGDFFDINANKNLPYSTTGENISNGEFYKVSNGFSHIGGTIGFTNDGSNLTLVAGANTTPKYSDYFVIDIYDENGDIVKTVNGYSYVDNPNATTVIYYGTYDDNKDYNKVETPDNAFIFENAELALPSDYSDFYGKGNITRLGKKELEIGEFAISTSDVSLQQYLQVGMKVRCQRVFVGEFAGVTSATGYNGVVFDEDGIFDFYANGNLSNRAPRTVIGMKEDGTLVMMVVDGRQGDKEMHGCDGYELTAIMRAYGCIKAYNVDGGGSSTIVVRSDKGLETLNSPSDGHERSDGNCILICTVDPDYKTSQENIKSDSATILVSIDNPVYKKYETYISLDGKMIKVVDGKVELTNLVHNNTYDYRVYYLENETYIPTQTVGSFTTSKANFKFLGLYIEEQDDKYIFRAYSLDKDRSGNVYEMTVTINGRNIYLKNGEGEVSKDIVGDFTKVGYEYWYVDENGRTTIIVEDGLYFRK